MATSGALPAASASGRGTAARVWLAGLAAWCCLLACVESGSGPTAPAPPVGQGVSFSPLPSTDRSIALRGSVSGSTLEVVIHFTAVEDLYGLSFEFLFPANLLRFESSSGGAFPSLQTEETAPGELLVGATQLGAVSGLNGGGTVAVVRFTAIGNGSGRLDFGRQEAFDSFGDRTVLEWLGGNVQVDL